MTWPWVTLYRKISLEPYFSPIWKFSRKNAISCPEFILAPIDAYLGQVYTDFWRGFWLYLAIVPWNNIDRQRLTTATFNKQRYRIFQKSIAFSKLHPGIRYLREVLNLFLRRFCKVMALCHVAGNRILSVSHLNRAWNGGVVWKVCVKLPAYSAFFGNLPGQQRSVFGTR